MQARTNWLCMGSLITERVYCVQQLAFNWLQFVAVLVIACGKIFSSPVCTGLASHYQLEMKVNHHNILFQRPQYNQWQQQLPVWVWEWEGKALPMTVEECCYHDLNNVLAPSQHPYCHDSVVEHFEHWNRYFHYHLVDHLK